jgi:hypothetical protein
MMWRSTIIGVAIISASFAAAAYGWLGDWAAVVMAILGSVTAFGIERYGQVDAGFFSIGDEDGDG